MKKKYVLYLILFILLFAMLEGCNNTESNVTQQNQTEKPVSTVSPAAHTAYPEIKEEETKNSKKRKIRGVTVTDETGEKHKLRLGKLAETDEGVKFCSADFIWASQISDGHYYYLHIGKGGKHTIYRDKKKIVGTFFIREGTLVGFAKVGKNYFASIMHTEVDPDTYDIENLTYDIVRIDLATQSVKVLLGNCAWDGHKGDLIINDEDIIFYRGSMYYDSRTDVLWDPGEYVPGAFLMSRDLKNIEQENKMICTKQMNRAKPYLTFVDGKILYGRQKGKEVSVYMFDLETKEQTKVVKYKRHKAYKSYFYTPYDKVIVSMDDDYLYCQDMAIPRKGGKIQPLLKNAQQYAAGREERIFSSNKKYIFYLDKKYHLHRINKETGEDILVSNKKLMSVQCMEDRIYVKAWRYGHWDVSWDDNDWGYYEQKRPDILYCMDLNGKVKWKHTMEKAPEEDVEYLGESE